jgi:hypothetical protein
MVQFVRLVSTGTRAEMLAGPRSVLPIMLLIQAMFDEIRAA